MSADLAEELSKQTRELASRFESRANGFRNRPDLARLTVTVDVPSAEALALSLFGQGEHFATGIDGSMDFDERLQMILFYANATAYNCPFRVGPGLTFDLASARRDERLAASAAVPLWAEDLGSVSSHEAEVELELEHSMERIPNSFMTLGELHLALKACERAKILFLDRPLSGTFSTLSRDARVLLKMGRFRLLEWGGSTEASALDLELAILLGSPALTVPSRARYAYLAVVRELLSGPRTFDQLSVSLRIGPGDVRRAAQRLHKFDARHGHRLLADSTDAGIKLNEDVAGFWDRVSRLSLRYASDVFEGRKHPLALGGDQYLTILDVNTISLVHLFILAQRARERGVLVVGVAKDTTATDMTRAVIPFATAQGSLALASEPPRLKNDRAFLAILSSENPSVSTPWRTIGYDACYSTMVFLDGRFRSARKVVSREGLFVRTFFQLRTLKSDPSVRSQVFLSDRLYDDRFDSGELRRFEVEESVGVTPIGAYFEGGSGNPLSNLVLLVLSLNDNPEVFEAYGHNQLLFLADKAVKAEVRLLRSSLRGVADLRLGGLSRRRKIFGLATPYRQQRAEAEQARSRA